MPRENRKRGKKHKKVKDDELEQYEHQQYEQPPPEAEEPQAGPSWIISKPNNAEFNEEAPFGYVDSEVKAYFRTVDVQIREWQEEPCQHQDTEEGDPNEGTHICSSCSYFVLTISSRRSSSILCCCSYRNVREGEGVGDRS